MKLSSIGGAPSLVYHSSASIWPIRNLVLKHQIRGVVHHKSPKLCVAIDLDSALNHWAFGPYILEIATVIEPGRAVATEYRIEPQDRWKPTKWGISFGFRQPDPALHWLPLAELRDFNHAKYDAEILKHALAAVENGDNPFLAECWAMDFMDGNWPELDEILVRTDPESGSYLHRYRTLPGHLRQKNWIHDFRADLYGHAVPKWSPLRPYDTREPHWTETNEDD
jgi:hypothetical protein